MYYNTGEFIEINCVDVDRAAKTHLSNLMMPCQKMRFADFFRDNIS